MEKSDEETMEEPVDVLTSALCPQLPALSSTQQGTVFTASKQYMERGAVEKSYDENMKKRVYALTCALRGIQLPRLKSMAWNKVFATSNIQRGEHLYLELTSGMRYIKLHGHGDMYVYRTLRGTIEQARGCDIGVLKSVDKYMKSYTKYVLCDQFDALRTFDIETPPGRFNSHLRSVTCTSTLSAVDYAAILGKSKALDIMLPPLLQFGPTELVFRFGPTRRQLGLWLANCANAGHAINCIDVLIKHGLIMHEVDDSMIRTGEPILTLLHACTLSYMTPSYLRALIQRGFYGEFQRFYPRGNLYRSLCKTHAGNNSALFPLLQVLLDNGIAFGRVMNFFATQKPTRDIKEVIGWFIENGLDINGRNQPDGKTPIFHVNNIEMFHFFVRLGADVHVESRGCPLMHYQIQHAPQKEIIEAMIELGVDVNILDKYGRPVALADALPDDPEWYDSHYFPIMNMMLDAHLDINHVFANGESFFIVWCMTNCVYLPWDGRDELILPLFQRMLSLVSDFSIRADEGYTILHLCAFVENSRYLRLLLSPYSRLQRNVTGFLPLSAGRLRRLREIRPGVDLEARDEYGRTALHVALEEGKIGNALLLIKHGSSVTTVDDTGETLLHCIVKPAPYATLTRAHLHIIKELFKHGVNATALNNRGLAPLHLAAQYNSLGMVRCLLEHGVDGTVRDGNGETALEIAQRLQHVKMVTVFMQVW